MREITVQTERPYRVLIGENILKEAVEYLPSREGKAVIIWDETIPVEYVARLGGILEEEGIDVMALSVEGGERVKTIGSYEKLIKFLTEFDLSRTDVIYAVGGGTVGDISGFIASTYKRGVNLVQVPTSLLAACDASVGGKTALNYGDLKNVIGTFYQPSLVIIDTAFFDSLDDKQFISGCAEMIKYAFLGDPDMFEALEKRPLTENRRDHAYLTEMVERSIRIKTGFIEQDEKDTGIRNILNFGHTFGHAIEGESGFRISHGQAVAMGMIIVTRAAESKGLCESGTLTKLLSSLERHGLSTVSPYRNSLLLDRISNDKKIVGDTINFVLPACVGKCYVKNMKLEDLKGWFND